MRDFWLYLIEFLHQTTTSSLSGTPCTSLYLIEFLHQTTTTVSISLNVLCCILLNFYIKPQPNWLGYPTRCGCILLNFYIKPQRSIPSRISESRCILLNFYIKPQLPRIKNRKPNGCILLNFYIKPQRRDGYRLILRILQPFDDSRNLLSVRRRSRFDVFFRISKNKYSKISQKNSNCWGISGFARSLFPQKFRISPYCLSVTARMLVYPDGGIERLTRLM